MLWGGRFETGPDRGLLELSVSTDTDMELLPYDVAVTKAHARALETAGLLEDGSAARVEHACDEILNDWSRGSLVAGQKDEDVHSVVERALSDKLGDLGRSIHAGRSRNDLVATDLRLWCRDAAEDLVTETGHVIETFCGIAEDHVHTVMPGYTHLQRAQPVTLGFHLVAHATALMRDLQRLRGSIDAANVSPLGAGALAGTTLPIDPSISAGRLGFAGLSLNSMDAVSDRDFAADLLYACSMLGIHLSRVAEEVVMWTSSEFGFARLADEWSTGSSMMPQKRNPDLAELSRGRAATLIGDLTGFLALLKGLPLAYDRDLQEDKPIVFRAVATARRIATASRRVLEALTFDVERMYAAAAAPGIWATDVAEELVRSGVPFRDAHHAAGALVARLESEGITLADAPAELLTSCHEQLGPGIKRFADPRNLVEARGGESGPAPRSVLVQIEALRSALETS